MKKLNAAWIVFIIFSSLIVIGGLFYLFYRLYINHIYKRKRFWNEIITPSNNESEEKIENNLTFLMPRQSILPLVQEFLPNELKQQPKQRKMVTELQFNDPPLLVNNLNVDWNEMDTKSLFSLELISTQTSYYTMREQISCEESIRDKESLVKYFSITSSNELVTLSPSAQQLSSNSSSKKRSSFQLFFNPLVTSSRSSRNYEKTGLDQKINIPNNVSKV